MEIDVSSRDTRSTVRMPERMAAGETPTLGRIYEMLSGIFRDTVDKDAVAVLVKKYGLKSNTVTMGTLLKAIVSYYRDMRNSVNLKDDVVFLVGDDTQQILVRATVRIVSVMHTGQ